MSADTVKLFVVEWNDNSPKVISIDAARDEAGLYYIPQKAPHGFGLLTPIDDATRERLCIGFDSVDAVYRAFEKAKAAEACMEKSLLHTRRNITELAVLGMAEGKVVL